MGCLGCRKVGEAIENWSIIQGERRASPYYTSRRPPLHKVQSQIESHHKSTTRTWLTYFEWVSSLSNDPKK